MASGFARTSAALAAFAAPVGAASPSPQQTDNIVVRAVVDPKVGSGILAIFAKVSGATVPAHDRRTYFILYMGEGQTLPAVGARCEMIYRVGRIGEWRDTNGKPLIGRRVDKFACSDGRRWPDGTPHRA